MRIRALIVAALAAVGAACHRAPVVASAPAAPVASFSMVLERSSEGWRAHCDSGCAWKTVTMSCATCAVRLDASGIGGADAPDDGAKGFAFVASPTVEGWEARGVRGVHWSRVTRGCSGAMCRGRVDESGVGGA